MDLQILSTLAQLKGYENAKAGVKIGNIACLPLRVWGKSL
jgi:hypothetical protein